MSISNRDLIYASVEIDASDLRQELEDIRSQIGGLDEDEVARIVRDVNSDEGYMTYSAVEDCISEYIHDNVEIPDPQDFADRSDFDALDNTVDSLDGRVQLLEDKLGDTEGNTLADRIENLEERVGNEVAGDLDERITALEGRLDGIEAGDQRSDERLVRLEHLITDLQTQIEQLQASRSKSESVFNLLQRIVRELLS